MPTLTQLINKNRITKKFKTKTPALLKNPQQRGEIQKVFTCSPKKPNSAVRKVVKIELRNGLIIDAYVPGEGHNLSKHGAVLIRGGRTPDLPGLKYRLIRGKYSFNPVSDRKSSRSLYGTKKPTP